MLFSRRDAMIQGAAVAAATALPSTEASAQTVLQRPSVSTLAPNHPVLVSYRTAITRMQALPTSDPRNWTRQAQIHLNNCPHGNWFFLPWHRAYLLGFERICRQLSGNPNFVLPYWDWTANPQLPAAFASQMFNGQPNALFNSTRSSQTVTIPANVAGSQRMATIVAETTFEIFGSTRPTGQNNTSSTWQRRGGLKGPFESGPHDTVHVRINGDMVTLMSPLDPIFWLHHCNIDRVWDQWNRMGRANTSSALWRTFAFNNQFVTPQGSGSTPFNVAVSGLLNIQTLGYRYVPPILAPAQLLVAAPAIDLTKLQITKVDATQTVKINTPLALEVKLNAPQAAAVKKIQPIAPTSAAGRTAAAAPKPAQASGRVLAILRDITPPANGNTEVRVFVNSPDPSAETSTQDRHYAGSFTFFGFGEHDGHTGGQSILVDLTETVRRLQVAETNVTDNIKVQLVPVPVPGVPSANLEFKVGSIEIAII